MPKKPVRTTKVKERPRKTRAARKPVKPASAAIDVPWPAPSAEQLEKLREAHKKVDPYQPLYGVEGFGDPQRQSNDRCEAICSHFGDQVDGLRVLDVGCYIGYLTFYLADRGAKTTGWDYWAKNIDVCTQL